MQNICQLNSLRDFLFYQHVPDKEGLLTIKLREFLICMWDKNTSVYSPSPIFEAIVKKNPRFRGYRQQDAHELLQCLLDGIHCEELSRLKSIAPSPSAPAPPAASAPSNPPKSSINNEEISLQKNKSSEQTEKQQEKEQEGRSAKEENPTNDQGLPEHEQKEAGGLPEPSDDSQTIHGLADNSQSISEHPVEPTGLPEQNEEGNEAVEGLLDDSTDEKQTREEDEAGEDEENQTSVSKTPENNEEGDERDEEQENEEEIQAEKEKKKIKRNQYQKTFIDQFFGGNLISCITCHECNTISTVNEPFYNLLVPIPTKSTPLPVNHFFPFFKIFF